MRQSLVWCIAGWINFHVPTFKFARSDLSIFEISVTQVGHYDGPDGLQCEQEDRIIVVLPGKRVAIRSDTAAVKTGTHRPPQHEATRFLQRIAFS